MLYTIVVLLLKTLVNVFFKLRSRGNHHIPPKKEACIFVIAPHANQFVDPLMLLTTCGRKVGFLIALKSYNKMWIRPFAQVLNAIPVERPQDSMKPGEGRVYIASSNGLKGYNFHVGDSIQIKGHEPFVVTEILSDTDVSIKPLSLPLQSYSARNQSTSVFYKIIPKIDHSLMFEKVTERLVQGRCVGIFPEGGSHDRSEFLPLKSGVALMALGSMAQFPDLKVSLVPVGLNYFHADKFRSKAVIEYGPPIQIERDMVDEFKKGGDSKKKAIEGLMDSVYKNLKQVTLTAPSFDQLLMIQTMRRLYAPIHKTLSPEKSVEISRKLAMGYEMFQEDPRIQALYKRVQEYNTLLSHYRLSDHQVKMMNPNPYRALMVLFGQILYFCLCLSLSLPGLISFSPIFLAAKVISKRKAQEALQGSQVKIKGNDVIATWKLLTALVFVPLLFLFYSMIIYVWTQSWLFTFSVAAFLPISCMITLFVADQAFDSFLSLYPLYLSVVQKTGITQIRKVLAKDIQSLVNELGPQVIKDFEESRHVKRHEMDENPKEK